MLPPVRCSTIPGRSGKRRGVMALAGVRVLVVGLGRFGGGVGVTRWLVSQGAAVTVTDQADAPTLSESIEALAGLDVTLRLGGHDPRVVDAAALAVINPAVDKSRSDLFQAIRRRRLPWTTEINLFCERCPARVIAVTGTFGKSTTAAMLAHALRACRSAAEVPYAGVHLGGNIGGSLLTELNRIGSSDLVVLEMSSAQLEDLPRIDWAPFAVVVTNLRPHHLDRYGTFAEYLKTKLHIVEGPGFIGNVFVGDLDPAAEAHWRRLEVARRLTVVRVRRPDPPIGLIVPGWHNEANAACALAVCDHLGLKGHLVRRALRSFGGLPHRLQHVRTLDGATYYNDSKSTSPETTIRALEALHRPTVLLVGGQDKNASLSGFAQTVSRWCHCVICFGESGPAFAKALRLAGGGSNRIVVCETDRLVSAVRLARARARPGDAVLFSPGAPSYDAYANFAERGQRFVELVHAV